MITFAVMHDFKDIRKYEIVTIFIKSFHEQVRSAFSARRMSYYKIWMLVELQVGKIVT